MKFIMTFNWIPDAEQRAKGVERFMRTGGMPPEGVKLLGRWTRADLGGGFSLIEAEDPARLAEASFMWSDLMALTITPVVEDPELAEVLRAATTTPPL